MGIAELEYPSAVTMPLDARLRSLLDYWNSRRGPDRAAPARADLSPADVPDLLPWIMLLDAVEDDYRHRLVGTGLDGLFGRPLTGVTLSNAWPARLGGHWRQWMDHACRQKVPVGTWATIATKRGPLRLDTVILPLSNQPDQIDMLLCGVSGSGLRRLKPLFPHASNAVIEDALLHFDAGELTV